MGRPYLSRSLDPFQHPPTVRPALKIVDFAKNHIYDAATHLISSIPCRVLTPHVNFPAALSRNVDLLSCVLP